MSEKNVANTLDNAPVFHIDGGELYYLAKNVYRLPCNNLSPFTGQSEIGIKISDDTLRLSNDDDLKALTSVLAQPHLKLSLRRGGLNVPLRAISAFIRNEDGKARIVGLQEEKGMVFSVFLDSIEKYGEYFASQNGSPIKLSPVNHIKPTLPLEVLIFIFNLVDCYRRAYLDRLLKHSAEPIEAIYEDEFITVFEQELKSNDIRWLLPSLIRLVPGLAETVLDVKGDHLLLAESMGFISRVAPVNEKRPVYFLGSSGKYMGLEFALFWENSVGLEVSALNSVTGKEESVGRYYFAATEEANHLITITQMGSGSEFTHLALTGAETAAEITKIVGKHLAESRNDAISKGGISKVLPTPKFCGSCGSKLSAGAAFCSGCGEKLG